jgi:ketosteroid isomerase-like protein
MSDDVRTVERPNLLVPDGAVHDRQAMEAASTAGATLLDSQRYVIHEILVRGDRAADRCSWSGLVGRDARAVHQRLRAEPAQFITVRDGRVASVETYDGYEPWDGTGPASTG